MVKEQVICTKVSVKKYESLLSNIKGVIKIKTKFDLES